MKRIAILSVIASILTVLSCSDDKKSETTKDIVPSTEFSTYVKAYTGEMVTAGSPIIIEFTSEPHTTATQGAISISPEVKGKAKWTGKTTLAFYPEDGQMKSGTTYTVSCDLAKLYNIKDENLKTFKYTFKTREKMMKLKLGDIRISENSSETASVSGRLVFSEPVPHSQASTMLKAQYAGTSPVVVLDKNTDKSKEFNFRVSDLKLDDSEHTLTITADGSRYGFDSAQEEGCLLPTRHGFRVISAKLVAGTDEHIQVNFSQPIASMGDYSGMFTIIGAGRQICEIEDNIARIYFERQKEEQVTLAVSQYLKSSSRESLASDYVKVFHAEDINPAVKIMLDGSIIPDLTSFSLPFKAVNLSAVDVRIIKIFENNILTFLQNADLNENNDIRRAGRLVYKGTVRLDTDGRDLHKWQNFSIDLSGLLKEEPGAIYSVRLSFRQEYSLYGKEIPSDAPAAMVSVIQNQISEEDQAIWDTAYPYYYENYYFDWNSYNWRDTDNPMTPSYYMQSSRFPGHHLISSNLGMIVKSASNGDFYINVNDIMTTDPVSNAQITAYNYQLQTIGTALTDDQGSAQMKVTGKPFIITAAKDGRTSYLKVNDGNENMLSRFDVGGKKLENGIKGYVYGERGVWRPGDTIHLTAIIDDPDKTIPANHPATVEVYTPQGQFYTKLICPQGENGFYRFDISTNEDDPTGKWNAYVKLGGATFHKALNVETIKPNRLKINLDIQDEILEKDKTTEMDLTASWLTGPVAKGLTATAEMSIRAQTGTFKGFEGYTFSRSLQPFSTESYNLFETILDQNGKKKMNIKMPSCQNAPGMLVADIITKVHEPGGDVSTIYQSIPFSPYDSYVGIKAPETESYYETDTDINFKIATVDKNGNRVSGHRLEYVISKIDWEWWWEYSEMSYDSYVNSSKLKKVKEGKLTSRQSDNTITFNLKHPEWGRFLIMVRDCVSGHICEMTFMVDWPGGGGSANQSLPDDVVSLNISTDKKEYEVGEKCTVKIPTATGGKALISLENGRKVISRKWVNTSADADTPYSFTITEDMAPNCYIHMTLLQPHKNTANDLPIRMYGITPVIVSNKMSVLKPVITMPDVIRPQEEFTVSVKESSSREMTYTLAIVDEGLLDLTGFKTPNPWNSIYTKEALGVKTWDIYSQIAGASSGKFAPALSIGGDEYLEIKGSKQDNRFKPVVKFMGPFTTKGKQTHKITLPLYVGSVKVMVVAGKDGAYGNAEKTVAVRNPLMVLPTLPRILGTDESISVPVNVFALEDNINNVNVSISVEGPVSILSSASNKLNFTKTGDKMTRFQIKTNGEGLAKITVKATGNGYSAEDVINIQVRDPRPATLSCKMETLEAGKEMAFEWDPSCEWVKFEACGFPSIDYNGLFTFNSQYSHYCTEQICSRGISLLYSMDRFNAENQKRASEMIEGLLSQLYSRQMSDGGFRYWPSSAECNGWCSIMAGHFMTAAIQKGYQIDKGVYDNWLGYQQRSVRTYRCSAANQQQQMNQSYALYTLALAGVEENGAMNRMKESKPALKPARDMLASAYALCGKKQIAQNILYDTDINQTEVNGSYLTFGSDARDMAIALESYTLIGNLTDALDLAKEVAQDINFSGYTTQTAAFAAVALDRLSKLVGSKAIHLEVTQKQKASVTGASATVGFDVDKKHGSAVVKNTTDEPVHITMTSFGKTNKENCSSRISMNIKYTDQNGETISPDRLKQGQEFTGEITVTNLSSISYDDMALTMRIPAGWEIFIGRLYDIGGDGSSAYTYQDIRDDRCSWYFDLAKGCSKTFKIRLSATYEGAYIFPSVTCEAMYDNSVYAYSRTQKVSVER